MIHIRIDTEDENSKRKFACGIGPKLPQGDVYFFPFESMVDRRVNCPKCREACGLGKEPRKLGTPISEVTPEKLDKIAQSWREEDE